MLNAISSRQQRIWALEHVQQDRFDKNLKEEMSTNDGSLECDR